MKFSVLSVLVFSLVFAIPHQINYQGKITDAAGVGLDGTYSITFRIYDVSSGGTELWSENHPSVNVHKGLFDVILGSGTSIELPFDAQYYLQIEVNGEILTPRIPLKSTAYSYRSEIADSAVNGGGQVLTLDFGSDDTLRLTQSVGSDLATRIPVDNDDLSDNVISDLSDVNTSGVSSGQVLKWNGSAWVPGDDNTGAGGGITDINSQTGPSITIANGSGISVSSASNTITITNAAPWTSSSNDYIQNQSSADQTASFRISGNGYIAGDVGIGTISPSYKLDVRGDAYIQSELVVDINSNGWGFRAPFGSSSAINFRPTSGSGNLQVGSAAGNRNGFLTFGGAYWCDMVGLSGDPTVPSYDAGDIFGMYPTSTGIRWYNGSSWSTISGGGVGGSGSVNYIAKWTPDGNTLGNSVIYDNGVNVGIGTTSPNGKLNINTNVDGISYGIRIDEGSTNTTSPNYGIYVYDNSGGSSNDYIRHDIYAENHQYQPGTGYTNSTSRCAIAGADFDAGDYNFGVGGWSYLDNNYSGGVLGSNWGGTIWGSLAYKDGSGTTWAGYFNGDIYGTGLVNGNQLQSRVATGTSPILINSTTLVSNLNADMVDGHHYDSDWNLWDDVGSYFQASTNSDVRVYDDGSSSDIYVYKSDGTDGIYVYSSSTEYGAGESAIFGRRSGTSGIDNGGTGWTESGIDCAVKGYSYWGNKYTAGVAGFNYCDYDSSCGVFGGNNWGDYYGILGYRDDYDTQSYYGGYFRCDSDTRPGYALDAMSYGSQSKCAVRGQSAGTYYTGWFWHDLGSGNPGLGTNADFYVGGTKSAYVPTRNYGTRVLYCEESAEIYFTDYGSARLENGHCTVQIDPVFLQTVTIDDNNPMKVFIQMTDECPNGVYVKKGKDEFEVIEQNGGHSNATFDYRIVAKRKGFETRRLTHIQEPTPTGRFIKISEEPTPDAPNGIIYPEPKKINYDKLNQMDAKKQK